MYALLGVLVSLALLGLAVLAVILLTPLLIVIGPWLVWGVVIGAVVALVVWVVMLYERT